MRTLAPLDMLLLLQPCCMSAEQQVELQNNVKTRFLLGKVVTSPTHHVCRNGCIHSGPKYTSDIAVHHPNTIFDKLIKDI